MQRPNFYTKEEFLHYLTEEGYDVELIEKFNKLEEVVKDDYVMTIVVNKDIKNATSYELNYYSKADKKHLLPYKIEFGELTYILENFIKKVNELV